MAAFRERFNKSPPQRATLLDWKKNELSLLEVLKTGREVGERQRTWKQMQRLPLPLNVPQ
jgi:hypothetical protein